MVSRATGDPIINPNVLPAIIPIYLGRDMDPTHPYASPLFGDYRDMPPLLLQVGNAEVLLDDYTRLATHAARMEINGRGDVLLLWNGVEGVGQLNSLK